MYMFLLGSFGYISEEDDWCLTDLEDKQIYNFNNNDTMDFEL